jgi:hypothetical protein
MDACDVLVRPRALRLTVSYGFQARGSTERLDRST